MRQIQGSHAARGLRFAIVVARYHDFITDRLQAGALEALAGCEVAPDAITVIKVPGAFEIPLAAQRAAETGQFDAVVCLGCLIKGETAHFEYIAAAVAHGIARAAAETGLPMTFGVLTTNSAEEALERAGDRSGNKGWEAAMAAVETATLFRQLVRSDPAGIRV